MQFAFQYGFYFVMEQNIGNNKNKVQNKIQNAEIPGQVDHGGIQGSRKPLQQQIHSVVNEGVNDVHVKGISSPKRQELSDMGNGRQTLADDIDQVDQQQAKGEEDKVAVSDICRCHVDHYVFTHVDQRDGGKTRKDYAKGNGNTRFDAVFGGVIFSVLQGFEPRCRQGDQIADEHKGKAQCQNSEMAGRD